jgi:hypothetical protein
LYYVEAGLRLLQFFSSGPIHSLSNENGEMRTGGDA